MGMGEFFFSKAIIKILHSTCTLYIMCSCCMSYKEGWSMVTRMQRVSEVGLSRNMTTASFPPTHSLYHCCDLWEPETSTENETDAQEVQWRSSLTHDAANRIPLWAGLSLLVF